MFKRFKKSKDGFTLVELIVTITIVAILIAFLVPSLIGYIEESHAKKDNVNMKSVVRSVEIALAEHDIYKAVVKYSTEVPAKYEDVKKGEAGTFSTTEKISKGITITFYSDEKDNPSKAKLSIENAVVNAGVNTTKGELQVGNVPLTDIATSSGKTLYNIIEQIVGESITLDSETYKNSNYTIFIELDEETASAHVYGQWNGVELFESVGIDGVNGDDPDNPNVDCKHNYTEAITKPATCTSTGVKTFTCNKCNNTYTEEIPMAEHNYEWKIDVPATETTTGTKHQECTNCHNKQNEGTIIDKLDCAHSGIVGTAAKAATCTEAGNTAYWYCSNCDKYFGDSAGQNVIEKDSWNIPVTEHNYKSVVIDPTCTSAGYTTYTCSDCGDDYTESGAIALGHDFTAENATDTYFKTAATCTSPTIYYKSCSRCELSSKDQNGESVFEYGNTLEHTYGEPTWLWSDDCTSVTTTFKCTRSDCVHISTTSTTVTAGAITNEITIPATCTTTGEKTYTATITFNGKTYVNTEIKIIPKTEHNWRWEVDVPATEISTGIKHEECSHCHIKRNENTVIDKLTCAHSGITGTAAKAATCTEAGNSAYWYCSTCNKYFSDANGQNAIEKDSWIIAALGHNYNSVVTDPTCTVQGYTTHTCSRCDDSYVDSYVNALAHNYEWIIDTPATEISTGIKHEECTRCHIKRNENTVIDKLTCAHSGMTGTAAKAATCTSAGNSAYWYCSTCNKYFNDANGQTVIEKNSWIIAALGHNYDSVVTNATCTAQGYTTHTCSRCNDSYKDSYVNALGHNYEWVIDKSATETSTGIKHEECSRCHLKRNENTIIDKLTCTHSGIVGTAAKAATCTEAGNSAYWYCSTCDKYFSDANGQSVIEKDSWIIAALGHNYSTTPTWSWTGYTKAVATFNCTRSGCTHTDTATVSGNAITNKVTTAATCTATGVRTYTATVTFNGNTYTNTKTETIDKLAHTETTIPAVAATCESTGLTAGKKCSVCGTITVAQTQTAALGHSYSTTPTWSWTGYSTATATFNCTRSGCTHTNTATASGSAITNKITTAATCTATGIRTYTATVTFNGKTYTDTKTETITKLAHTEVEIPAVAATCTSTGLTAGKKCSVCDTITVAQTQTSALGHNYNSVVTSPTCTEQGYTTHTCSRCGDTYKDSYVDALDHNYISKTTAATCITAGYTTYTCSKCGDSYTDDPVMALGHDFTAENATDIYFKTAATCTSPATYYKSCSRCELSSKDHAGEVVFEHGDALGHAYETPTWSWSGYTSATATFKCTRNGCAHSSTTTASGGAITNKVTTAATCTATGIRTYTATVTFNGKTYTDTKTETIDKIAHTEVKIPAVAATCESTGLTAGKKCSVCGTITVAQTQTAALGHSYSTTPTWSWTGYTTATATFKCTRSGCTHANTATASDSAITNKITTAATCTATGVRTYTATITFNSKTYTNTKTETIDKLGHNYDSVVTNPTCESQGYTTHTCSRCNDSYKDTYVNALGHSYSTTPTWSWSGYTTATATFKCTRSGCTHTSTATASGSAITNKITTAATCTATGVRTYTATVTFNGKTYTDTKTETIAKIAHTEVEIPAVAATCESTGLTAGKKCSVCGTITVAQTQTAALGHSYSTTPTWSWTGYTKAVATFNCTRSGCTHTSTATASGSAITNKVTTAATCTATGVRTYTATVTFNGKTYTGTKTETIDKLGHNYSATTNDGYTTYKCANCSDAYGTMIVTESNRADIGYTDDTLDLTIPSTVVKNGVTYDVVGIGSNAFYQCTLLESVVIPNGVTTIDDYAFYQCTSLTSVTIPNGVTTIGDYAFSRCTALENVTIPSTVKVIGDYAFQVCRELTSITIPNGVTTIGSGVFQNCTKLASVIIPNSVTSIGKEAFVNCTSLGSVSIPSSVTSIGVNAFGYCTSLTDIYFDGTKAQWEAITKGTNWDYNVDNYIVHCTDGDIGGTNSETATVTIMGDMSAYTYTYEVGMTWADLVNSDYNTNDTLVVNSDGTITITNGSGGPLAPGYIQITSDLPVDYASIYSYEFMTETIACNSSDVTGGTTGGTGDTDDETTTKCDHTNTSTINASATYTGDTYCNDCKTVIATGSAIQVEYTTWKPKTWNIDLTIFNKERIWTDGTNTYYSSGTYGQYVLKDGAWETKTWSGYYLRYPSAQKIWTDGTNIYYSDGTEHYVLNDGAWERMTWNGLTDFSGEFIWTDGTNIYYSFGTDQYVLNGKTWKEKYWGNCESIFNGTYTDASIWTDGTNIYYSYSFYGQYVLKDGDWEPKTWNIDLALDKTDIWTDGTNIYYSDGTEHYVLNDGAWEPKTWNGLTDFSGWSVWTDGTNIYYSYGPDAQYVLCNE